MPCKYFMKRKEEKSYSGGQLNLLPNRQTIKRPSEAFLFLLGHIQGHKKLPIIDR